MCGYDETAAGSGFPDEPASAEARRGAWAAALEAESEALWVERQLASGALDEVLTQQGRARALAAPDEVVAQELLAQALEGESEAACIERALGVGDERLAPSVRAQALAAFVEGGRAVPMPTFPLRREPLRARRLRAPWMLRPVGAAALVLVALGLGALLWGGGTTAEAGLRLRALSRMNLGASVRFSEVQPAYLAPLGRLYAPAADELLAFGLAEDGLVVVGGGDALRVSTTAAGPVLRLESGEARLATRGHPVPLEIAGVGRLVLEQGAAHVALHAETVAQQPALALAAQSTAYFVGLDGRRVPFSGPTRVLLGSSGPQTFGTPARSLFRELEFMGGPLPRPVQVRDVSARLFEVRSGPVRRGRQDLRVLEPAAGEAHAVRVRLAWRPPPVLADAQRLRVGLRAPQGTRVAIPQHGATSLQGVVAREGGASEPGVTRVEIALPPDWHARLPGGCLELVIDVPAPTAARAPGDGATPQDARRPERVRAWFDGIALVLGPSEGGLPVSMHDGGRDAAGAPAPRR